MTDVSLSFDDDNTHIQMDIHVQVKWSQIDKK